MVELLFDIMEWIESGGFIDGVHYDDASIVAMIREALGQEPTVLDAAVDAFKRNPKRDTAGLLRMIAAEYAEDGMIAEETREQYFRETASYMESK